jgi:hypothetical protein
MMMSGRQEVEGAPLPALHLFGAAASAIIKIRRMKRDDDGAPKQKSSV